jgi:hypothetical protein
VIRFCSSLLVTALALAVVVIAGPGSQPGPDPLLLTGARILDTRGGRYLPSAAVLIVGDRIVSVTAQAPANLPGGVRRIALDGATLVPGLGDMFATASPDGSADADFYYSMALAHGVMSYRVVGGKLPWATSQRDRVRSGDVLAPRLWVGGPRIDQAGGPSFSMLRVLEPVAARREVARQGSLQADWIAVSGTTSAEISSAVVRAARTAKLKVSGEPGTVSTAAWVRLGVNAIDHLGFFAKSRGDYERDLGSRPDYPRDDPAAVTDYLWQHAPAAETKPAVPLKARWPTVIPMLGSFGGTLNADQLKQDPALALLPARWRDEMIARAHPAAWPGAAVAAQAAETRGRLVRWLASRGAPIATGVDVESAGYTIPGAGIHREMALLVAAGFQPAEAIKAATISCADLLGASLSGQVRTGFHADLFAVQGDPLAHIEDLQRITLIVRGGEVLDRNELLAEARRAVR